MRDKHQLPMLLEQEAERPTLPPAVSAEIVDLIVEMALHIVNAEENQEDRHDPNA